MALYCRGWGQCQKSGAVNWRQDIEESQPSRTAALNWSDCASLLKNSFGLDFTGKFCCSACCSHRLSTARSPHIGEQCDEGEGVEAYIHRHFSPPRLDSPRPMQPHRSIVLKGNHYRKMQSESAATSTPVKMLGRCSPGIFALVTSKTISIRLTSHATTSFSMNSMRRD